MKILSSNFLPLIPMMQTTNTRQCNQFSIFFNPGLNRAMIRCIFWKPKVGSVMVIIRKIFSENFFRCFLFKYDNMIETVSSDTSNKPFDKWTLPWWLRGRYYLVYSHVLNPLLKETAIYLISTGCYGTKEKSKKDNLNFQT